MSACGTTRRSRIDRDRTRATPTGEQIARAKARAEVAAERYANDGDLDRTDDEWRAHVFLGVRAEVAAEQFFRALGFDARIVDDDEEQAHDLEVEGLAVEVKLRRLWTFREPDMLLRFDDVDDPDADLFLMVEAEKTPHGHDLVVTKWANQQTVREHATGFREDRPRVPREHLSDVETLLPLLKLVREEGGHR
ncbi:hypothetical protein AUR64_17410 [Haloprofundus marisrubri]|uniref:Uncharacterized protein n=1 Tax=Haloprofundus marisrubri TaxID=1514971 RepID=A0A0W1R5U2_9EURY|nr:hypothetical protein [Haloprofundus marisrubri]KTG08461.1 hypothetical protein AUR64_17410 [Haloprofundus marisrubri]